jgi:hypothetical protein
MTDSRRGTWAALVALLIACLAIVVVPVVLIRPFSPQTPASMALAFTLRKWSPIVTLAGLVAGIVILVRLWRPTGRIWARIGGVVAVGVIAFTAWGARQNHFEWMFAPLPGPGFVRAAQADFVEPGDVVLTVVLHGDPVAYPVRQLAYHHVVEDTVGGVPIVATF